MAGAWHQHLPGILRRWSADCRGGIVIGFAIAMPVVAVGAVCTVELSSLSADKATIQGVSDSAALAAAGEMTASSTDAVIERAKSFADAQLDNIKSKYKLTIDAVVTSDPAQVTVNISAARASFFGNLVPPGGFLIHASSTAGAMGTVPLCVLSHSVTEAQAGKKGKAPSPGANGAGILLQNNAVLEAGSCMVQSNDDLMVKDDGVLMSAAARAGGLIFGVVTPSGEASAPLIADPFAAVDISIPDTCRPKSPTKTQIDGEETLEAGVHCGGLDIKKDAILTLAPGEHYFVGDVKIDGDAQFTGSDVVLIFDKDSRFDFKGNSRIALEGRKTGPLAGFVVITTRDNTHDFHIDSGRVEKLLGTLYVPAARLVVEGNQQVAQDSPWTVIVASQISLQGSPHLVINARYSASNVPVPSGVGPNSAGAHLVR